MIKKLHTSNTKNKSELNFARISILVAITLLLTLLAVSVFSTSAFAFEDYQLSAPFSPVTVASCSQTTETLLLTNSGSDAAQINLNFIDSHVAKFARMEPSSFFMTPGAQQQVTVFINAPCQTEGTFDFSINLQGNTKSITFDRQIILSKINNIDFIATKGNVLQSCPCVPQTIPFTITNTGSWAESYTVAAQGFEQNVAVPQGSLFLAPGQTFSGAAFASFSCETYGTKSFSLKVTADNSKAQEVMPVTYNIAACYDYSLGTKPSTSICEQDSQEIVGVINNSAAYTNTFKIDASLPSFASLNGNKVTLLPSQLGIVPLELNPQLGDVGNYSYEIKTTSALGNFFATATGNINVQHCYDYNVVAQGTNQNPTTSDSARFDICAPGYSTTFTITNNGERTQEMHVNSTDGRFVATPSVFNLTAGASRNISLSIPSVGIENKMYFNLNVWSSANPNVVASKQITIQPHDLQSCYGVEVSPVAFVVNNSKTNLSLQIKNNGLWGATYALSLSGPQWTALTNGSVYIPSQGVATIGLTSAAPLFIDNATYVANLTVKTAYTQQTVPIEFILNPNTAQWLLWFLIIALLILIALLVILLAARKARSRAQRTQIDHVMTDEQKRAQQKELKAAQALARRQSIATAKREAAQAAAAKTLADKEAAESRREKARERAEARRNRGKKQKHGLHLLFIILIVAILLALLMMLIVKDTSLNGPSGSSATNNSTVITKPATNNTITTIVNTTTVANITKNATTNSSMSNTSLNVTQVVEKSLWQNFVDFISSINLSDFNIFDVQVETTNLTNGTISNTSNITTITNNTTVINITHLTNVTTTNVSTNQNSNQTANNQTTNQTTNQSANNQTTNQSANQTITNQSTSPAVNLSAVNAQRQAELEGATLFLNANEQNPHVFILTENQSGILNMSHYFVDPENMTLRYEFIPVNATKTTAVINGGLLSLQAQDSFVGMQTFKIMATNQANLSTTSPIFTLVVLDKLPSQSISQSVQIGLLTLLIIIAVIVYFDIRLISRQYEYAKSLQQNKNDKKKK